MITCTEYIFTYLYIVYIVFILKFTSLINAARYMSTGFYVFIVFVFSAHLTMLRCAISIDFLSARPSVCQAHALRQNEIVICKFANTITIE